MPRQFNATKPQSRDGMTISDLAKFLKTYIDLQFPKNSIDYWSDYPHARHELLTPGTRANFSHVACSVYSGGSEGQYVDMRLILSGDEGRSQLITRVKCLGDDSEQCWAMARAASEVIETLYIQDALPRLVEFAEALPGKPWEMEGKGIKFLLSGPAESCLDIDVDGEVIAVYDFADKGNAARHYIEQYHADWKRLATNWGMEILCDEVEEESPVHSLS
jgi:hypothetical protein